MGRPGKIVAALLGVVVVAWLVGSLDWRPSRAGKVVPGERTTLGTGLLAGAAVADVTPSGPLPLGGFGSRHGAGYTEVRDRVHARVVVLGDSAGHRIGLVSLDAVLVPGPLAAAIRRGAKAHGIADVVVTATHTHNGPGGLWKNPLAELIGLGWYHGRYVRSLTRKVDGALADATAHAVPVAIRGGQAPGPKVCKSRVSGRAPDRTLTVVEIDPTAGGAPIARIVVFACHATVLGAHDHRLSAGWPGVLAAHLSGVTLFMQGAVGDVTSKGDPKITNDARMVRLGEAVARAVEALPLSPWTGPVALDDVRVDLPAPTGDTIAPAGLRALAGNLVSIYAPAHARVSALTLGGVRLAMLPGEPVSPLASRWTRGFALLAPGAPVRIVGLADGYLGYLETPEALAARAGESREAFFGPKAIALMHRALVRALSPGR